MTQALTHPNRDNSGAASNTVDVSFIVAAHNVAPFIEEAIASALQQTGVRVEVLVMDDGSSDETGVIAERMGIHDPRVRVFRNSASTGPAAARNRGIAQARGTWLAVLDGDDVMAPERCEQLLALATAIDADIVADNFERITIDGAPTGKTMFATADEPFSFCVDVAGFLDGNRALERCKVALGAIKPIIRHDFVARHGLTFPEKLMIGEDYQFLMNALLNDATFVVSSQPFYKYRVRPGSQSWRLRPGHVEQLIEAHRQSGVEARAKRDPASQAASERYVNALERAARFVDLVEALKSRRISQGLAAVVRDPAIWPLVARFGADAVQKRALRMIGR